MLKKKEKKRGDNDLAMLLMGQFCCMSFSCLVQYYVKMITRPGNASKGPVLLYELFLFSPVLCKNYTQTCNASKGPVLLCELFLFSPVLCKNYTQTCNASKGPVLLCELFLFSPVLCKNDTQTWQCF